MSPVRPRKLPRRPPLLDPPVQITLTPVLAAWVLRDPFGKLVRGTLAEEKSEAQSLAFSYLDSKFPDGWPKEYWKRWDPFIKARKRRGWHVVQVKLVEIGDAKA